MTLITFFDKIDNTHTIIYKDKQTKQVISCMTKFESLFNDIYKMFKNREVKAKRTQKDNVFIVYL